MKQKNNNFFKKLKAFFHKRMQEIINITRFLTRQNVCNDMQNEILKYLSTGTMVSMLKISVYDDGDEDLISILEEMFEYVPNRTNYSNIINLIFETVKKWIMTLKYYIIIEQDQIRLINIQQQTETIYKFQDLAKHLENNTLNNDVFPFNETSYYDDLSIQFNHIKLKSI